MSMSPHVIGLRKADNVHVAKVAAWRACKAAGVEPPDELAEYFGHVKDVTDTTGLEVELDRKIPREWSDDAANGLEIDLDRLPKGVCTLRFYNSW